MADEYPSPSALAGSAHADSAARAAEASAHGESSTKGMLRDAIHKVMEEIEYHEREAKKHTQKAGELRKDLRESFAFLQEKKGDGKPAKPAEESRPDKVAEPSTKAKAKDPPPDDKSQRANVKKKPAAGKTREK